MQERISWYKSPIDRDMLKNLTRRSDWKGLIQTLGFIAIVAATGTAAALSVGRLPVWAVILLFLFHGTVWAFHINAFHELVHRTVFKSGILGGFFLNFISFTGLLNPHAFRASHTRHHLYTLHSGLDGEVTLPITITLRRFLSFALINPVGLAKEIRYLFRTARGIIDNPWIRQVIAEDGPEFEKRHRNWARFLLIGHATILAGSIAMGWWMIPVLITFARFYGQGLQFLCNETQHVGLQGDTEDFRLSARTFTLNPVLRFLYWHMNYHLEHHMFAAVPCYNLRKLNKLIADDVPPPCRGLYGAWREIIDALQKQKADPAYRIRKVSDDTQ